MRQTFLIVIMLTLFSASLQAGAAFAEARDNNDNATSWIFFMDDKLSPKKSGEGAVKQLREAGHATVIAAKTTRLNKGFYAVVFAAYEYKSRIRFRYGYGFSSKSVDDAKKDAVKTLKKLDPHWKTSEGFELKKTGTF